MDFGLFTEFTTRKGKTQAVAFQESFSQVEAAEELGMDSVWLGENHFMPELAVMACPVIVASAIAARTRRVRIGLAVQVLPLANPLRAAEEAATVDHISGGRFDFGVGRSGLFKFYHGFNIDYAESRERFFEGLEVIKKAWTEDEFSHEGKYFSYHGVTLVPKPYQKPHPPIIAAVASEDTFALMGSAGYSVFASPTLIAMADIEARLRTYRTAWEGAGHAGAPTVLLRIPAYVAETAERAASEPEDSAMHRVRAGADPIGSSSASPELAARISRMATVPYEQVMREMVMFGTPEAVAERIHEYRERLGISGILMDMNYGGQVPHDRIVNSIRLFTEKVMPQFK